MIANERNFHLRPNDTEIINYRSLYGCNNEQSRSIVSYVVYF